MKKYFLIIAVLFAVGITYAQPGKKPSATKPPSTQKEIEERAREVRSKFENLTPEQKKMMEEMGIQPPNTNVIPGNVSNNQIAMATGATNIPPKDEKRIAGITKTLLTTTALPVHLKATRNFILQRIKANSLNEKIYAQLKSDGQNNTQIGAAAVGLWINGRTETALYIISAICEEHATHTDNLNNYASMLTMSGAEQLAIPLLSYLNSKYKGNSTILNNMGQAWFGLGDIIKAEKYLDSAIRIYAHHPQANYTKSFIEESKGNKEQAIESVKKSIKYAYSLDKENSLRKLGYKLNSDDVSFSFKPDTDPMGLHNFQLPPTPKSAADEVNTAKEWVSFIEGLNAMVVNKINEKNKLENPKTKKITEDANNYLHGKMSNQPHARKPIFYKKAQLKLIEMNKDGGVIFRYNKALSDLQKFRSSRKQLEDIYFKERNNLDKTDNSAEGRGGTDCKDLIGLQDKYLKEYNTRFDELMKEYLHQTRLKLNEELYWKQFLESPEDFAITKYKYQIAWLAALTMSQSRFIANEHRLTYGKDEFSHCLIENEQKTSSKLQNFNDVNCQYKSELDWGVLKMKMNCNNWETQFDLKFIQLGLKQDMDKETFSEQFVNCTIQIKAEAEIGNNVKLGPLEAGVSAEAGVEIEIDRTGITDVSLIGGVKGGIGIKNEKGEINFGGAGVEAKVSLITGKTNFQGTGILSSK